ncbi:Glycosyltransferase involved in cell wall bisynthesis [Bosea sp. TND4EK4]|nr:Glycosyltransferase involved in cell wall bisynthesis [Bosea sp. TND4EK4]
MLVPHEPSLDPRIHYTAAGLAKRHTVKVVSTTRSRDKRPAAAANTQHGYEVVRLPYMMLPWPDMAWQAFSMQRAAGSSAHGGREPASVAAEAFRLPLYRRLRTNVAYLLQTLAVNHTLQRYFATNPVRPDIIFCHDLYVLQTGVQLKQQTGSPLVYDSHEYYAMQFVHPTFVASTLWYERKLASHTDLRLTVSPQLASELAAVLGTEAFEAIPNAEPRPSARVRPLGTEMASLAKGRVKFLYQGNFVEGRGLDDLLREWLAVDGDRATLFLRGPENAVTAALRSQAEQLKLLGRSVYFLPPVFEADLIAAAAEADIGIIPYKGDLPSYRFACPNKLSQYMHAGLAVLTNDIPFVADMVRSHEMGWVYNVSRPGSLAEAVASALDAPALELCRARAHAAADTDYCWEVYEDKLLGLVDKVAAAR